MLMVGDSFFFFNFLTYTISVFSLAKFIFKYIWVLRNSRFQEILFCFVYYYYFLFKYIFFNFFRVPTNS